MEERLRLQTLTSLQNLGTPRLLRHGCNLFKQDQNVAAAEPQQLNTPSRGEAQGTHYDTVRLNLA